MRFVFSPIKALQAIGVLLRRERCKRTNYMRLLKVLYIADRETLRETGQPITGDRVIAMERGPVLEGVYDLIRGQHPAIALWSKAIHRDHFEVELIGEVGVDDLSRFEINKLEEVANRYEELDEWDMVRESHKLPEWQKNDPGTSSKAIPVEDILEAVGRLVDKAEIEQYEKDRAVFAELFGE